MLETKYYKDMNHNYLIIKGSNEQSGDAYQLKMITGNRISGLLACSTRYINGDLYLYYEIHSLQCLRTLYEYQKMSKTQAFRILTSFRKILREIQSFLLMDSGLLLMPEFIFINWETNEVYFVYYPFEISGVEENNSLRFLLEYMVEVIDHHDEQLVDMIYGLCQLAEKRQFVVDELDYYLDKISFQPSQALPDKRENFVKRESGQIFSGADTFGRTHEKKEYGRERIGEINRENMIEKSREETMQGDRKKTVLHNRSSETISDVDGESIYIPSLEKNQEKKLSGMVLLSAGGIIAIVFVQNRYILTSQETLISWVLLFIFIFILVTTGIIYVLLKFSMCTEKKPVINANQDNRKNQEIRIKQEERDCRINIADRESKERYGDTVFLYSTEEISDNKLYGMDKGNKYMIDLGKLPCTIGKMEQYTDYCIAEPSISRMHVKFTGKNNAVFMTDLNSTNGTFKNGLRLQPSETVQIEVGDEIRLGKLTFCYR